MIEGSIVGIVIDNVDPEKMHRIKVDYPMQGEGVSSTWARMMTPMGGNDRGLVTLPEIGTEVVLMFAYRSLSPYVVGAIYNGGDDTDPYANSDGDNNLRLVWTRNDNQVVFDDTPGAEAMGIGTKAPSVGDVTGAPVYQHLDASKKTWNEYSEKDITWEAVGNVSIKCKTFSLQAQMSVKAEAGMTAVAQAGQKADVKAGSAITATASSRIDINGGSPQQPKPTLPTPSHSHPPVK